jgi:hypothetical protein
VLPSIHQPFDQLILLKKKKKRKGMRAFWCGHFEPITKSQSHCSIYSIQTTTRLRKEVGVLKSSHDRE